MKLTIHVREEKYASISILRVRYNFFHEYTNDYRIINDLKKLYYVLDICNFLLI